MTDVQIRILDMMKYLHRFCIENNIRYYALGGTMLGAARHEGYIPWDDDIDVGMPRRDYERFIKLFQSKNEGSHYIVEAEEQFDYAYAYAKMYDVRTTLIENFYEPVIRGLYIDIFPLDGIGQTYEESIKRYKKIERQRNIVSYYKIRITEERAKYKNLIIRGMHLIPKGIMSMQKSQKKIAKISKQRDFDKSEYVGNLVGAWGAKEIMNRSTFGEPTLYRFEDMEIFGAEKYDEYLSNQYGNWKQLPPEDKRKSHHQNYLDLEKPYYQFAKESKQE